MRKLAVAAAVLGAAMFFLYRYRSAARGQAVALLGRSGVRGLPLRARAGDHTLASDDDAALADRVRGEVRRDPRISPDGIAVSAAAAS